MSLNREQIRSWGLMLAALVCVQASGSRHADASCGDYLGHPAMPPHAYDPFSGAESATDRNAPRPDCTGPECDRQQQPRDSETPALPVFPTDKFATSAAATTRPYGPCDRLAALTDASPQPGHSPPVERPPQVSRSRPSSL